ncbi:MAG: hypothetical protein ACI9N1_000047 [Flavobacteriales bacterium]|jgi:hypothetical protein
MDKLAFAFILDRTTGHLFVDFLVNNESLYEKFELDGTLRIGVLGWSSQEWETKNINIFLSEIKPVLDNGRVELFVCSDCGDIGCGATTLKLTKTNNKIVWSEFGDDDDFGPVDCSDYETGLQYQFDELEYGNTFEELKSALLKLRLREPL